MSLLQSLDIQALQWIIDHLRVDLLTPIMVIITHLCDHAEIWILLALLLMLRPQTRTCGFAILAALALGLIFGNGILKNIIARPRPYETYPYLERLIPRQGEYSFPSGHTLASFGAATALFCFYQRPGLAAYAVALLIGFSRLYVAVHYPSDVLVGAALGLVTGLVGALLVKHIDMCFHRKRLERAKGNMK